jgi:hypothetical protein
MDNLGFILVHSKNMMQMEVLYINKIDLFSRKYKNQIDSHAFCSQRVGSGQLECSISARF